MGNFLAMLGGDCRYQNVGSLIRHFLLGFHGSLTQTLLKGSISSVLAAKPLPPSGRDSSEANKGSLHCQAPFNGWSQTQALILLEPAYLFPSPPSLRTQSALEINSECKEPREGAIGLAPQGHWQQGGVTYIQLANDLKPVILDQVKCKLNFWKSILMNYYTYILYCYQMEIKIFL